MNNQAAYLTGKENLELLDCEVPEIGPEDVLLKMEYVGICGSDLHFYRYGRIGRRVLTEPFILGHECSGTIHKVGVDVKNFVPGDRITLEPGIGCGVCEFCRNGRYNLCPDVKFISSPPDHGSLRQWMAYPAKACFKLPPNVSTLEGAMIEPLSVGLHAAARGSVGTGKVVMIQGAGCIGVMSLLACKAMNAEKVIVTDISDGRLRKAAELGADCCINGEREDVVKRTLELTNGYGADIVFEAAGTPKTALQAIGLIKRGGTIVQVGNITAETPYVFNELSRLEVDIRTTFRYCNDFQRAIDLVAAGSIKIAQIAPKIYPFRDARLAFSRAAMDLDHAVKYMIAF